MEEGIMIVLEALPLTRTRNWFFSQVQVKSSYATFAILKEAVLQQVQKTYKVGQDVAKSLGDLQHIYLHTAELTRVLFTKTTPEEQAIEQAGLDIK